MKTKQLHCGDIYYVDLGEYSQNIQGGIRPCLILGNEKSLNNSNICQVIPLTASKKTWLPVHIFINLSKRSTLLLEQIQTVNQNRIQTYISTLSQDTLMEIENKLLFQLGFKQA